MQSDRRPSRRYYGDDVFDGQKELKIASRRRLLG